MKYSKDYKFSRDELINLFKLMDQRLLAMGKNETVYIVGGAAMSLSFNKDLTSDVDGYYDSNSAIQVVVDQLADEFNMSDKWFNNSINQTMSYFSPDEERKTLFIGNNLSIEFASQRYVLAMKLAARREKDISDVRTLITTLGLQDKESVVEVAVHYFKADMSAGSYQRTAIEEFLDVVWDGWINSPTSI